MKLAILTALIGAFAHISIAQAAIRGVQMNQVLTTPLGSGVMLTVSIDVCRSGYPTVSPTVTKLAEDMAMVALHVFPGTCAKPDHVAAFSVPVELSSLGLDPSTSKIFVQLQ